MVRALARGIGVCTTILDGILLARAVCNHSINCRSALVLDRKPPARSPENRSADPCVGV
jgi:hypothetical protein